MVFCFLPFVQESTVRGSETEIKYAPSALGLDPENDPVLWTTESGLEIKFGGAAAALGGGNETTDFLATLASGKPLSGYPYFTMGTYNGYAVNWVIIGKSTSGISSSNFTMDAGTSYEKLSVWQTKIAESPTYKAWFENHYESTSPAGSLITNHGVLDDMTARHLIATIQTSLLNSIPTNAEIDSGCVLVVSEYVLFNTQFRTSSAAGNYNGSNLQAKMVALYESGLGLTDSQKAMIVPQTIKNYYSASYGTATKQSYSTTTEYLFSCLCGNQDNSGQTLTDFVLGDYLATNALRKAYTIGTTTASYWWTRQGHTLDYQNAFRVDSTGNTSNVAASVTTSSGVRPWAVVDITQKILLLKAGFFLMK